MRGVATLHGDSGLPVPTQIHLGILQSGLNLSNFRGRWGMLARPPCRPVPVSQEQPGPAPGLTDGHQ